MKNPVVFIGIGEMGSVFARGFLRSGYPVYPVTRDTDMQKIAREIPDPELVMVSVAEGDLHAVLDTIPTTWKDRIGLLQNELLPGDWKKHGLNNPTVISVWFEKKKGQDSKVIIPSPVYGSRAELIKGALGSIDIAARTLNNETELLQELVLKNVYILTTNICGLKTGGNVGELWSQHENLARIVANEVMDIQEWFTGETLDRNSIINGMVQAFNGDLEHKCMGRSAPARLERTLKQADEAGLGVSRMKEIEATAQN